MSPAKLRLLAQLHHLFLQEAFPDSPSEVPRVLNLWVPEPASLGPQSRPSHSLALRPCVSPICLSLLIRKVG